jgi:signal transduction histidine kinase
MSQGASDVINLPFEATEVQTRMNNYLQIYLARKALKSHFHCNGRAPSLALLAQNATIKAQELDRTNKMKDDFLAMLSHELRNPINVISGFAEVLVDNSEDAELAKEAAETIYRNAQFQAKLIQDLMDVSRSMNGKMILECRPLELDFLLEEMLPSVETAAQKKNIDVKTQFNCAGLISGDCTRITQVIWNLISNAIKFTPDGGRVEIELRQKDEWIELLVRDTGIGIDPVFLPQIFEQFHQQDTNITRRFGGLGLGLTIVKNIVELHQGHVHAFSEGVGHGSSFILRLPSLPS